jgi:hypothetical protein
MTISMYKASAPIFVQFLTSLSTVLDKAAQHIESRKLDESFFVNARLYPDMFSLARQVQQATQHAVGACARTAGQEPPKLPEEIGTIAQLRARIGAAIDFIKTCKAADIDGSEDRSISITTAAGKRDFIGQSYLLNFTLPHFYFHVTTAYDILRHNGVEIGKRDYMGTPVQM